MKNPFSLEMVFFGIVPVGFAAFGNYVMPLQIGAVDMAFPRLNMGSVILFFFSAIVVSATARTNITYRDIRPSSRCSRIHPPRPK
jgi:heme/copper-type cytochrome/quinol oxidase subunit 1